MSNTTPIAARFAGPRHRAIADLANEHLSGPAKAAVQSLLDRESGILSICQSMRALTIR